MAKCTRKLGRGASRGRIGGCRPRRLGARSRTIHTLRRRFGSAGRLVFGGRELGLAYQSCISHNERRLGYAGHAVINNNRTRRLVCFYALGVPRSARLRSGERSVFSWV
jgi:hypothetical protein